MDWTKGTILAVACLLGGIAIGFNIGGDDGLKNTDIRWKYGDSELVIDLEKDLADDKTMLGKIFSENYSRAGAVDWLKTEQSLFTATDPDLADAFEAIEFEAPLAERLRNLRNSRKGPWSYQVQEVKIGIPDINDQPFNGYANVCESGIFRGEKVELFLIDRPDKRITVNATGRYSCPEGYNFPDVQLSSYDAKKLFGYNNFSKYERAGAVVIHD